MQNSEGSSKVDFPNCFQLHIHLVAGVFVSMCTAITQTFTAVLYLSPNTSAK